MWEVGRNGPKPGVLWLDIVFKERKTKVNQSQFPFMIVLPSFPKSNLMIN